MRVKNYTHIINGEKVMCYNRTVKYMVFFRTLGEYQRFRLLFEDENSDYKVNDVYQDIYIKFGGKVIKQNRYLDRLLIESETKDREILIRSFGLRILKKKEKEAKKVRSGMLAYETV